MNGPALAEATVSEQDGVRYLHLGTPWIQGAMRLRQPQRIELEYVRRMMAWMLWFEPAELEAGHAVQLGLGAGAITRFCRRVLGMRTTAVELNPSVIAACRSWFRLPTDDERLQLLQADARQWVADPSHRSSVQALCVDLYDHEAAAPVLDDESFYADCRTVLAPGGLMSVNLFGRAASCERSAARIAAVFGRHQVWRLRPTREGNTVLIAGRGVALPPRTELRARAAAIEAGCELPARGWLRMLRPLADAEGRSA